MPRASREAVEQRRNRIASLLLRYGELSVAEFSHLLGLSQTTVRRDLATLVSHRLIERTRGGARHRTLVRYSHAPVYSLPLDPEEARAIAARAAELVEPGDVIGLSGGSICTQLALRIQLLEARLTVVTNAINIAVELVGLPNIKVVLTGGQLNRASFELVGKGVALSLNHLHIHRFFIGTDGLSPEHGVTAHDEAEAESSRAIMEHSDGTVVLADSSKFSLANFAQVAPTISDFEAIVTTDRVPQELREQFEAAGVRVFVAPVSHSGEVGTPRPMSQ